MLFEKEKYYKYITDIESSIIVFYATCISIFGIIGVVAFKKPITLLAGVLIGMLIAWVRTHDYKIKVQEMKMRLDEYRMFERLTTIK